LGKILLRISKAKLCEDCQKTAIKKTTKGEAVIYSKLCFTCRMEVDRYSEVMKELKKLEKKVQRWGDKK